MKLKSSEDPETSASDSGISVNRKLTLCSIACCTLTTIVHVIRWPSARPLINIWNTSGELWQSSWNNLLDVIGDHEMTLWWFGTLFVYIFVYWLVGGIFTVLDLTNGFNKYKVQPGSNEPVDKVKLAKAIKVVVFNQIVVHVPFHYCFYLIMSWSGAPPVRELPSLLGLLLTFVIVLLVEEVGFYYAHRLMHNRHMYRHIHKRHHEWTAPIAVIAMYCHPLEHVVCNLFPLALAIALTRAHLFTAMLVTGLILSGAMIQHCGYRLPSLLSPEAHDFHHLKFNECYGPLGIMDRLHKTNKLFLARTQAPATRQDTDEPNTNERPR